MSRQCPLCGKNKPEEALFCTDCEKKIRTEYEIDLPGLRNEKDTPLPGDQPDADDANFFDDKVEPAPLPGKKKTGKPVLWTALVAVLLVGGFFVYNETIRKDKLDQSSWESALKVNSVEGYLAYMSSQPEGAHFEEAQAKLMIIKADQAAGWEKLKTTDNISALRDFLQQHPESPYASLAKIRLDSLSWVNTLKTNTAAAYSDYIIGVESGELNGDYFTMAEERYEMLFQAYPVDVATLDSIRGTVSGFYAALSTVDKNDLRRTVDQDGIIPYLAPVVDRFFSSGKVNRERIAGELLTAVTRTQDTTLQFIPDLNGVQYEKTLYDTYRVNVPLTKSYLKEGIVEQVPGYIAHLALNSIFQIISIYETKPYPGAP